MSTDDMRNDHARLDDKHIEQIIAFFGEGQLADGSACSKQFRAYLSEIAAEKLGDHARRLLDKKKKIEKGGYALQDIINEMGARLGFTVNHGRYSGTTNDIGYDGVWQHPDFHLVVEVKTTDAYSINLDTIAAYRDKYIKRDAPDKKVHILIIVGRDDTGDLEAQIRGSKHNWSMRMISVEALMNMMFILSNASDDFHDKIRKIFIPVEYTRLDHMVAYISDTHEEVEKKPEFSLNDDEEENTSQQHRPYTADQDSHDALKKKIVAQLEKKYPSPIKKKSKTLYFDSQGNRHFCLLTSKLYKTSNPSYWRVLNSHHCDFLKECPESFVVFGCLDKNEALCIPFREIEKRLEICGKTIKKYDKSEIDYHHRLYSRQEEWYLHYPSTGEKFFVTTYRFELD